MFEVVVVEGARVGLVRSCRLLLTQNARLAHRRNPRLVVLLVELREA